MFRIALIISLFIVSCKSGEELYKKANKRGFYVTCEADTVWRDSIIKGKDGEDSIIYVPELVIKEVTNYVPKWKYRFDNERFEDSIKWVKRMYSDSLKYDTKVNRSENKVKKVEIRQSNKAIAWWQWLIVCIVCLFTGLFIGKII